MKYASLPSVSTDPDSSNFGFVHHKLVAPEASGSPSTIGQWQRLMLCQSFYSIHADFGRQVVQLGMAVSPSQIYLHNIITFVDTIRNKSWM